MMRREWANDVLRGWPFSPRRFSASKIGWRLHRARPGSVGGMAMAQAFPGVPIRLTQMESLARRRGQHYVGQAAPA